MKNLNILLGNENNLSTVRFFGYARYYGEIMRGSKKNVLDHVISKFNSIGIKNVIISTNPKNLDFFTFTEPTLIFYPKLQGFTPNVVNNEFFKDGAKISITIDHSSIIPDLDKKVIKYKDYIIGHYYPSRNLFTCYINMIKQQARIKHFNTCFSLIFNGINIEVKEIPQLSPEEKQKQQIQVFLTTIKSKKTKIIEEMKDYEISIQNYNNNIINYLREVEIRRKQLEQTNLLEKTFEDTFIEKLKELDSVTFLKSYKLAEDHICLNFGEIIIEEGKRKYYIGEMIAIIYPSEIKFDNLNNKVNESYRGPLIHPHVRDNGTACFGTYNNDMNKLLANFEFKKLAIILRQFLYTWNPRSPINQITNWKSKSFAEIEENNKKALARKKQAQSERNIQTVTNAASRLTEAEKKVFLKKLRDRGALR